MSRYGGIATCDHCGRTVSYKTGSSSSSDYSDSGSSGCCLIGCLAGLIKIVFWGSLILLGVFAIGLVVLVVWLLN